MGIVSAVLSMTILHELTGTRTFQSDTKRKIHPEKEKLFLIPGNVTCFHVL